MEGINLPYFNEYGITKWMLQDVLIWGAENSVWKSHHPPIPALKKMFTTNFLHNNLVFSKVDNSTWPATLSVANITYTSWSIVNLLNLCLHYSSFCICFLLHDYNLCVNGFYCYTSSYYNYKSISPYYIVIHR